MKVLLKQIDLFILINKHFIIIIENSPGFMKTLSNNQTVNQLNFPNCIENSIKFKHKINKSSDNFKWITNGKNSQKSTSKKFFNNNSEKKKNSFCKNLFKLNIKKIF